MRKHPFDPVSFLFGMLFTVVGVYLATGNTSLSGFENERMWPLFVVVAGLLFLVPALGRVGRQRAAQEGPGAGSARDATQHTATGGGRDEDDEAPSRAEDDDAGSFPPEDLAAENSVPEQPRPDEPRA